MMNFDSPLTQQQQVIPQTGCCHYCGTVIMPGSTSSANFYFCSYGCEQQWYQSYSASPTGEECNGVTQQQWVPQAVTYQSFQPNTSATGMCLACANRAVAAGTGYCSKRCAWVGECRCPQCGRERDPSSGYCSRLCSMQAAQANWCPHCGIRQITPGSTHCSTTCASVGAAVIPTRRHRIHPHHPNALTHHVCIDRNTDKMYYSVASQLGSQYEVLAVVKIHPDNLRRKKYLCYRSVVEQSLKSGKYGHGGEGNEQRKFFPLRLACNVGLDDGIVTCKHPAHDCMACSVLQHGFSMRHVQCGSHFCASTAAAIVPYCVPNTDGVKAVVIGRAVIGVPQFVSNHSDVQYPIEGCHCTVVQHQSVDGQNEWDDVCIYRDDGVDPQYLVLFRDVACLTH